MSFLAVFFIVFFVVVFVLAPILGGESRPGFLRPNRKARQNVGPPWR
jgi:hypothetical protein